jgi:HEAT repeat protein
MIGCSAGIWITGVTMGSKHIGSEQAFEMLRATDPQTRKRAVAIIVEIGEDAIPRLQEHIADRKASGRAQAVEALGIIRDARSVPTIARAMAEDPSHSVRRMAAWSLGEIGEPASASDLAIAIDDKDSNVGWEAILALEKIGTDFALEAIANALIDEDRPDDVREGAAKSLGRVANPEFVPHLLQAILSGGGKYHHGTTLASWQAIQAMGEQAIDQLEPFLDHDDPRHQEAAAESLKAIGTEKAIALYGAWHARGESHQSMNGDAG